MKRQKGFIDESTILGLFIVAFLMSIPIGWALIEGLLYLCNHISIGWVK